MNLTGINEEELAGAVRRGLKDHWQVFVVQGLLFALLGALAIAVPVIASVAIAAFAGWLLVFSGVFRAVTLVRAPHAPGYLPSLLLAILAASVGIIIALFPLQGAVTLTMLLTAYFIVHGIASFMFAFAIKGDTRRWVLVLLGGLVDLALAGFVIAGWPQSSEYILGLYVGISLLFTGFMLTFAALDARKSSGSDARLGPLRY